MKQTPPLLAQELRPPLTPARSGPLGRAGHGHDSRGSQRRSGRTHPVLPSVPGLVARGGSTEKSAPLLTNAVCGQRDGPSSCHAASLARGPPRARAQEPGAFSRRAAIHRRLGARQGAGTHLPNGLPPSPRTPSRPSEDGLGQQGGQRPRAHRKPGSVRQKTENPPGSRTRAAGLVFNSKAHGPGAPEAGGWAASRKRPAGSHGGGEGRGRAALLREPLVYSQSVRSARGPRT